MQCVPAWNQKKIIKEEKEKSVKKRSEGKKPKLHYGKVRKQGIIGIEHPLAARNRFQLWFLLQSSRDFFQTHWGRGGVLSSQLRTGPYDAQILRVPQPNRTNSQSHPC